LRTDREVECAPAATTLDGIAMSGSSRKERGRVSAYSLFGWCGGLLAGASAILLAGRFGVPPLAAYLVGVNIAALLLYGYDKRASGRESATRVPELTLHAFALLGGSPLAFVGQRVFRHKTRKRSFQIVFWSIVAIQVALAGLCVRLGWLRIALGD
jgi:uncharacterized membrane protein YsdA (DUF1294 family)